MSAPVITAWSALSPFGGDTAAFRDGVLGLPATPAGEPGAEARPLLVPGFDVKQALGRRGTRAMDRATALAVVAVRDLLDSVPDRRERATGPTGAIVLGTTMGSAASAMQITRDSLTGEKPFYVEAARVPNAIMNCPAGQSAIWQQVKGPNTTLAGGRAAGLLGLRYSRRLLDAGRASAVLCGAVEEFSPQRQLLEERGRPAADEPVRLGEGAAVLMVEHALAVAPEDVLAEVLAVESGVHGPEDAADRIAGCVTRTLNAGGVAPEELWAVSTVPRTAEDRLVETQALDTALGSATPTRFPLESPWGDAGAVTAVFQIASVLATAHREGGAGRPVLILAVDPDGLHAAALLRIGEPS
ncbi:beta-ketoacyl synthase N-terminal-like domain-containing protein [Saccharothrix sp. NRRL B-16314]|uniref:beta-ketoacyl synthase N-terminal-like domain-containing protein n=1 Tax=Saccharothrix sp. NRRL B-16314 TaxID=1463825 RepID=UPI000524D809|nr:beta-ketoacyl synthase N-terminal-like domain-containing protein [Saccharothrix sp. NRRL B-16314]